jgi:copper transport protein
MARVLVVVAAVAMAVFGGAGRAQAHPTLLFTTPAVDTADPTSPATIVLVFNEPVAIGAGALTILDPDGAAIGLDEVATARGGTTVTGHVTRTLTPGVYTLRWRVTGADGDLVESTFRFAVGAAITGQSTSDAGVSGTSWPPVGRRWLLFAGFALALGGAVGARITAGARQVRASLPAIPAWTRPGALAGLVAAAGLGLLLASDTGWGALVDLFPGRVLLVEAAAFACALGVAATRWRGWAWLPLLAVPVAEGVRAHPDQAAPGWGALLTGVHLLAAGVWAGALVQVVRAGVVWRGRTAALRWLVTGYARWAAWSLGLLAATSTVAALVLVPLDALTTTAYGRLLLVKVGLVAVAAGAALTARWWLRRDTLARTVTATRVEVATLGMVLAVTAALVSTPTARDARPVAPPPPAGVVLPLATLAGQVGVAVAASDGQLIVRLSAPKLGDYYETGPAQTYRLAARLHRPDGHDADVDLGGCGEGCYVADVDWGRGTSLLSLAAQAEGWRGGTVSLLVAWPVVDASARLARVAAALRDAGPITVYESVTSDTAAGPGDVVAIRISGAQLLATEPYSSGQAPQVVQTGAAGGTTTLAVGFPADSRYVQLSIDDRDRIRSETVVDAKHVTRRTFVYDDTRDG